MMRSSSPVHGSHETAADLEPYRARQREFDEQRELQQRQSNYLTQALGITARDLLQPTGQLEPLREATATATAERRTIMCKNIAKKLIERRKKEGGLKKLYMKNGMRNAEQFNKERGIIINMGRRFKEAAARGKLNHTRVRTAPCLRLRSPRLHPASPLNVHRGESSPSSRRSRSPRHMHVCTPTAHTPAPHLTNVHCVLLP